MKKKTTIREKLNSKSAGGSVLPLLGIALIIFTLTVAVYFAADYVAQSYASDDMLSNWNYTYTEKAGALPSGELRVFNAQNPIITERSVRKNNIYLIKTVEASDHDRTVTIMTDFAPAKIKLNGKLIYDNRFDKESYVGNCYNSFVIRKSTHEQTIEVFLKLPFSLRFEAYISENADPRLCALVCVQARLRRRGGRSYLNTRVRGHVADKAAAVPLGCGRRGGVFLGSCIGAQLAARGHLSA